MVIRSFAALLIALLLAVPAAAQVGPQPAPAAAQVCTATPCPPANGGSGVANTGNLTWPSGGGTAALLAANNVFSAPGAASTPGLYVSGAHFTGGSGTTTFPQFLVQDSTATAATTWPTTGTAIGANAHTGVGDFVNLLLDGNSEFRVTSNSAASNVIIPAGGLYEWSSSSAASGTADLILGRKGTANLQLGGNDGATATPQILSVQNVATGTSNTGGGGLTLRGPLSTGSGTSGDACIQTGGTGAAATIQNTAVTGLCVKGATQVITLPAIASDATHTDTSVCQDTTTHGLYAGSGTLGVCLGTSSARYKRAIKPLPVGLAQLMAIKPVQYFYRAGHGDNGARLQYGVTAENMAKAIPALASNDAAGKPNTADLVGLIPVLVNAIHEQQVEIEDLRRQVRRAGVR